MAGCEGHLGGNARHNDSDSRLGGGGGAGAGVEAEGDDEESAGGCADCSEDTCPFKSAEERTYDGSDSGGDGGDEVLNAYPQTRHQDSQNAGQDTDDYADDCHGRGNPQYFCRPAQNEAH